MFRSARKSDDRGYTLVEMLVVISLLGVVSAVATGAAINISRASGKISQKSQQSDQERVAFDTISKSLRSAVRYSATTSAFVTSGTNARMGGRTVINNGTETWFYTNLNTANGSSPVTAACGPEVAHYYVNSTNQLVEERYLPDSTSTDGNWTYTKAPAVKRVLVNNVVAPGAAYDMYNATNKAPLIFTYDSLSGGAVSPINTIASPTLSDAAGAGVAYVRVQLQTRTQGAQGAQAGQDGLVRLVNVANALTSGVQVAAGC